MKLISESCCGRKEHFETGIVVYTKVCCIATCVSVNKAGIGQSEE